MKFATPKLQPCCEEIRLSFQVLSADQPFFALMSDDSSINLFYPTKYKTLTINMIIK